MPSADLSVIIPNYNHARYLPRALQAILRQSVQPREVIVIDDASRDDSVAVAESFAHRHGNLRVVRNERNLGVAETVNRGIASCSGRYLFLGAADDLVLPGFFEKTTALLDRHPHAGVACAFHSTLDGNTGEIHANPSGWCRTPMYLTPQQLAERIGLASVPGHASIYRRDAFQRAGCYLADLRWHCDWFSNLVVAFRHGICHVPEMLSLLTVMPTTYSAQGTSNSNAQQEVLANLVNRLRSPEFGDVAPYFAGSGLLGFFGPDIVRCVASRPDRWDRPVLSLLAHCRADVSAPLLQADEPELREYAGYLHARAPRRESPTPATRALTWVKRTRFGQLCKRWLRPRRVLPASLRVAA